MATVAPPVGHSFAQQELDTFTIRKISFIVVLLRNCGATGTGVIYYLKNRFYCGIYCGFTISVNAMFDRIEYTNNSDLIIRIIRIIRNTFKRLKFGQIMLKKAQNL